MKQIDIVTEIHMAVFTAFILIFTHSFESHFKRRLSLDGQQNRLPAAENRAGRFDY